MHELSIAMSILEVAAEEAQRQGLGRVDAIHLKLGPLSGVVGDTLLNAYELAREMSPLDDARLVIDSVEITANCPGCRCERPVVSVQDIRCAVCGTPTPEIVHGRELEVVGLEVDA